MLGRSLFRCTLTLSVALVLVVAGPQAITRSIPRLTLRGPTQAMQAWSWGSNNRGQLGDGTINYSNVPVKARGLPPDIVTIAAGGSHVLALQRNGHVWAWGNDDSGQLGVKTPVCRKEYGPVPCARTPLRIPTLHDVVAVSAGGDDSLALERNGTVWNWGANGNAQLGSDPGEQAAVQPTPTRITRLAGIVAIATSGHESAAIRRDGTVWAWGEDNAALETTASDPVGANGPAPVPASPMSLPSRPGQKSSWRCGRTARSGRGATTDLASSAMATSTRF